MIRDFGVSAARGHADGAAVLLRSRHPVGKTVIGGDMVKLRGRLVVPGAPRRGSILADHRALIAGEDHSQWISGMDPELVIVVTAGRSFDGCPVLAAIDRLVD